MQLPGPIVSTDWLEKHINDESLRIYDVSIFLTPNDPEPGYTFTSGYAKWSIEHIPGANFLDLLSEFSDAKAAMPYTMLPLELLADKAGQAGITNDSAVVLYSADSPMFAARMWWMLRSIGLDNVAILDGGWNKWKKENRATSDRAKAYPPSQLNLGPRSTMWVNKDDVIRAMEDDSICILNALESEVHNGEVNRYGRAGHIPGSQNVSYDSLIDNETGEFLPAQQLQERFSKLDVLDKPQVLIYCGAGVVAAMNALALTLLGHSDVRIYDGSMIEWASDSTLPLICSVNC
ncbi:hypothetical protein C9J01_01785 [Photobacterium rosenbergii]|uniref:Rhodanese domain-containing protein n=1 Tax=Photobacterium rosenbergii TaxID=294936 RepID=A0A2T3NJZ8_9GAMM|nr:sulfurtransferase [Photobacterium rosenbergii]PSW15772.1 hypothetical protein C9J01_01785 [Photobacterium rosenbergii]